MSKCKIGQKLKRRGGEIVVLESIQSHKEWPYVCRWNLDARVSTHDQKGRFWPTRKSESDIIAILPPPKRKVKEAKPRLLEISDANDGEVIAKIAMKLHGKKPNQQDTLRAAIKLLQSLLK